MAKKKQQEVNNPVKEDVSAGNNTNIIDVIWNFFSSMKLGIILLIVVSALSIIGTLKSANYETFYRAWYYVIPLGLLLLNLIICSINRWKQIVSTLKGPKANVSENFIKNLSISETVKKKVSVNEAFSKVTGLLKGKGYKVATKEEDGVAVVAADKGRIGILGPYITHIGFIIIILALLIKFSGWVGFSGGLILGVGETKSLTEAVSGIDASKSYNLKLNDFSTEYYSDGQPKDWFSKMTVIDGDKTFDYTIHMNAPLDYKGIKFYQSSYGVFGKIKVTSGGQTAPEYVEYSGDQSSFRSIDNITIIPVAYNKNTKQIAVEIYNGNTLADKKTLAINEPATFESLKYTITDGGDYTYLSVKNDPSVPVIFVGTILLMLGIVMSFMIRQKKIWARIVEVNGNTVISLGGLSPKSKPALIQEITEITDELREKERRSGDGSK